MDIYFRTKKLQKLCSESREAHRHLGTKRARRLQQRMMELKAAISLDDISRLPPVRCHELTGNRKGQLSVDLEHPYRLLFIPANNPLLETKNGGLNWTKVTEIEIIEIIDPH